MIKLVKLTANNFKQLRNVELRFPDAGSVLVEGRNEAGKSTLFEAIFFGLFGRPLVSGTVAEDLIAYDANDAIVELTIALPDGQMVVQRKLRRTKTRSSGDARLRLFNADGEAGEEVKGASAVNARIQQELKLDADAFLNSCFVEQKKLEKLEGMTGKDRETSLMRLLNLDRIMEQEKALKLTLEDTRRLERQLRRLQLSEVMERIPAVMKRGREVLAALNVIALKEDLSSLETERAAIAEAEARRDSLAAPIAELEARALHIDVLKAAANEVNIAAVRLGKAEQAAAQADALREDLAELERLECRELPALRTRLRRLGILSHHWTRLSKMEDEAAEVRVDLERNHRSLAAWESAQELVQDAKKRLAALAEPIRAVEGRIRRLDTLRAALNEAEMARVRLGQIEQQRRDIAALQSEIEELDRVEREDLPALSDRLRRAGVLRRQWTRIQRLRNEADRLTSEAAGVRERLARLEGARAEVAKLEARVAAESERVASLTQEAERLERSERAVSVRQALEDWQAADHARRSLSDLELQITRAEQKREQSEGESADMGRKAAVLRTAAQKRLLLGGGLVGAGLLTFVLMVTLSVGWLWGVYLPLAFFGFLQLHTWRRLQASAGAVRMRHSDLQEAAREAQNALVRLEGQYENARASQGAAAGRLETAAVRLEALDEPVPSGAAEAARRLADLPNAEDNDNPDAMRARLSAVRGELAALQGGLDEQNRTLDARRRELEAEKEPLLRQSADRLEARAARITETILDHWMEVAAGRAVALCIPVTGDLPADQEATGRAIGQIEVDIRVTHERLETRGTRREQIARTEEAIASARRKVADSFAVCPSVCPDFEAPVCVEACEVLRAGLEAEMAALDEDGARAELTVRRAEQTEAESDRTAGMREAQAMEMEIQGRFGAPTDANGDAIASPAPEDLRAHAAAGIAALEARAARIIEGTVEPWMRVAAARAESLSVVAGDDVEENGAATMGAIANVNAEIGSALRRLEQRPSLEERIGKIEAQAAAERRQVAASLPTLATVRPDTPAPESRAEAEALRAGLEAEIAEQDEETVRAELEARRKERTQAENDRNYHERTMEQTTAALRERAERLRLPADIPLVPEALSGALPMWASADPANREALEEEFEKLKGDKGYLDGQRENLAHALGLDPDQETWDVEKERADYEALRHDQAVREQALTILNLARNRIVDKVLPYTIEHMRRILPALTMDRYHDARLTDDYKIEVWDERASLWKSKNIFSGGTRDQFSLALRLAFAMATLPQERGAAPGFIFLDEPLSSFDLERSEALMYLLTRGEIADTFAQIFVISHNHAMATTEFGHRIRMDAGRITEASEDLQPEGDR